MMIPINVDLACCSMFGFPFHEVARIDLNLSRLSGKDAKGVSKFYAAKVRVVPAILRMNCSGISFSMAMMAFRPVQ